MRERWYTILLIIAALVVLSGVGLWYAGDRGIPPAVSHAILPAFLLEVGLYLLSGTRLARDSVERIPPVSAACLLSLSAPVSWLLLTTATGMFDLSRLAGVLALGFLAAFWYVAVPRALVADLGFLVVMAAPVLFGAFDWLYPDPAARIPGKVLGLIMWYRIGLLAVLAIRHMEGIGFGFWPGPREWVIGLRNFVYFLPVGLLVAFGVGFIRLRKFDWDMRTLLLAVLTFAGVLLVLAVAEELFFRGLLQQQMSRLLGSNLAGLAVASIVFGAAHLGYRQFPNWKFALLAALAGLFYGRAYLQAGSIRAAMVTHALVVTTWKTLLIS